MATGPCTPGTVEVRSQGHLWTLLALPNRLAFSPSRKTVSNKQTPEVHTRIHIHTNKNVHTHMKN